MRMRSARVQAIVLDLALDTVRMHCKYTIENNENQAKKFRAMAEFEGTHSSL